jgi:hypothetical protein
MAENELFQKLDRVVAPYREYLNSPTREIHFLRSNRGKIGASRFFQDEDEIERMEIILRKRSQRHPNSWKLHEAIECLRRKIEAFLADAETQL